MFNYNEIVPKKHIVLNGEPYEVLSSHIFRKQQRKPINQTRIKNIMTGRVTERSFHQSETVEEANIENRSVVYLYNRRGEWWFYEKPDRSKRFCVSQSIVGERGKFLKENMTVSALYFKKKNYRF